MKNNITAWVLTLFFFFAVPLCHGARTLADADSAYSRGDYQAAVDAYVDVMESQGYSAPLQSRQCRFQGRRLGPCPPVV